MVCGKWPIQLPDQGSVFHHFHDCSKLTWTAESSPELNLVSFETLFPSLPPSHQLFFTNFFSLKFKDKNQQFRFCNCCFWCCILSRCKNCWAIIHKLSYLSFAILLVCLIWRRHTRVHTLIYTHTYTLVGAFPIRVFSCKNALEISPDFSPFVFYNFFRPFASSLSIVSYWNVLRNQLR